MAAETSWHRYCTKLRHSPYVYHRPALLRLYRKIGADYKCLDSTRETRLEMTNSTKNAVHTLTTKNAGKVFAAADEPPQRIKLRTPIMLYTARWTLNVINWLRSSVNLTLQHFGLSTVRWTVSKFFQVQSVYKFSNENCPDFGLTRISLHQTCTMFYIFILFVFI